MVIVAVEVLAFNAVTSIKLSDAPPFLFTLDISVPALSKVPPVGLK